MNAETELIARIAAILLELMLEMFARRQAGGDITDAEIDESTKRVDDAVARWNEARKKKAEVLGHDTPGTT